MRNLFLTHAEAAELIAGGAVMFVAGSAETLALLPKGKWIGGSTPYFMTETGGRLDAGRVFCTVLDEAENSRIEIVPAGKLEDLTKGRFANGFSYVLIPAFSETLRRFALEAQNLPDIYAQPLIGWVTGIDLADLGKAKPVVVDGRDGRAHEDAAAVMHVALNRTRSAEADIVNLFTPDERHAICFPETGFSASLCNVDGVERNFADWLREVGADTALPLVSSYAGAVVNVSLQAMHEDHVAFYAPVIAGRTYHLAQSVADYPHAYGMLCAAQPPQDEQAGTLSFNCILNYLHANLEGRKTGHFVGPVTFGEIAYMLLNQTLVRLDLRAGNVF
ncbi:DUF6976 family protein [Acidocella sp.]|uniref:DUF6976 family protein n=1 Tax=Acidocella sp. TaxID=50710 RepID=UPI002610B3D8|nr:hypothetical protein [Acidocella sp.]